MTGMGDRLSLAGEAGLVVIARDAYGIPHVTAETAADAWLGMGYACARDRMFQMDYDRRRASGRWAEIAGPAAVDPAAGFVLTANNVIVDGDQPYISATFTQPFRAERIRERLAAAAAHTSESLAAMQADTVSWAARAWARVLGGLASVGPSADPAAEAARLMLSDWDGDLAAGSARALLHGCFQRALAEGLYRPLTGDATWEWITSGTLMPTITLVRRWLANDTWELLGGPVPAPSDGRRSQRVLAAVPAALADAFLAGQSDIGRKQQPRFVRVASQLPQTATFKVLTRVLAADRWNTTDPVWWRPDGRGRSPAYVLLDAEQATALDAGISARLGRCPPQGQAHPSAG